MPASHGTEKPRVYCAGPLFNQAERTEMSAIADVLESAGYPVFLPHRDSMEFRLVHRDLVERGWDSALAGERLHSAIFALDVYHLVVECDCVVWNLNGRTPDEGAVSEAAIAWAIGMPVIAFRDDVRSLIAGRLNPLLLGLVDFKSVECVADIPGALAESLAQHGEHNRTLEQLPARVQDAARDGQALWERMQRVAQNEGLDHSNCADIVAEFFAAREGQAMKPC